MEFKLHAPFQATGDQPEAIEALARLDEREDAQYIRSLRAYLSDGLNLRRAAERLGYSQPGLTGMLNRLEQEIGYPVLQRGSGGVSLTEAGEALMPHVERILRDSRALEQAIADHRPEERRILRIGSYTSISRNWLPPVLKGIQRVVCKGCHIRGFPCKDAEHAAFLVESSHVTPDPPSDGA